MNVALPIVAGALAVCPVVYAQNMVEYSNLATKSTTASNAIASTSRAIAKKASTLNAAVSQDVSKESPSGKKSAMNQNLPVSGPTLPAVFILSNGERLESDHYFLTNSSLCVQQDGTQRTIPLSTIDIDATVAANHERGIDLRIPKNKSEIMLSF